MDLNAVQLAATQGIDKVFNVLDGGLDIFLRSAERVAALKQLYADRAEIIQNIDQLEKPSVAESPFVKFLKSESGLVTIGAMGVLALGFLFTRGR